MKNVKKFMAVALAIVMAVAVLAGCGSNNAAGGNSAADNSGSAASQHKGPQSRYGMRLCSLQLDSE